MPISCIMIFNPQYANVENMVSS